MSSLNKNESEVYLEEIKRQNSEIEAKSKLLGLTEETTVSTSKQLVAQSIQPDFLSLSKSLKNSFGLISDTTNFVCTASSIYRNFNYYAPENVLNSTRNCWITGAAHNAWIKIEFGCTIRVSQLHILQPEDILANMFKAVKIIFSTENEPYKHTETLALTYKRFAWTGCKIFPSVEADSITINGADYYNPESLPQHYYGICQIQLHGRKIQS